MVECVHGPPVVYRFQSRIGCQVGKKVLIEIPLLFTHGSENPNRFSVRKNYEIPMKNVNNSVPAMSIPIKCSAIKQAIVPKSDFNRYLIAFVGALVLLALWFGGSSVSEADSERLSLDLVDIPQIVLDKDAELARARNRNCSFWDCFNVYRCGQRGGAAAGGSAAGLWAEEQQERISIYVYPLKEYVDADSRKQAFQLTKEFYTILKTIVNSPYYTANPNEACLFVPTLDTLNQNRIDVNLVGKALASLP